MKTYGEGGSIAERFITPAPYGGGRSASRPCGVTPGKQTPASTGYEAWWDPEPVWKLHEEKDLLFYWESYHHSSRCTD